MSFFTPPGYLLYTSSAIAAFLSGCIPFAILAAAAAFSAPSTLWAFAFYAIALLWTACYLVPLIFISRRKKAPSIVAIAGSLTAVLYCGYAIYVVRQDTNENPLSIAGHSAPVWLWLAISLAFNLIQGCFSTLKLRGVSR